MGKLPIPNDYQFGQSFTPLSSTICESRFMLRTYFHVDMDAFFVSVEELYDPSLKGKPVVVGGRADQRGVVAAASYAARKFGVHSAMPLREAARLCPQAVFLEGHPERYREASAAVRRVLLQFTPAGGDGLHRRSLSRHDRHRAAARTCHEVRGFTAPNDEARNPAELLGRHRHRARGRQGCQRPGQAQRRAATYLPGLEERFLAPLDVRRLPGVGKVTEQRLRECGVRTIGDLRRLTESALGRKIGDGLAALIEKARGHDAGGWYDQEVGCQR